MIDDMMPMILCDVLQVSQLTSNIRDVQKRLWILSNTDVLVGYLEIIINNMVINNNNPL